MKKTLIRWKIYTDRAKWYMGYVQMLITITILLQTSGIQVKLWYLPVLLVIIASTFVVVGYIEVKLGALEEEQKKYAELNPVMQQILNQIKDIKFPKDELK